MRIRNRNNNSVILHSENHRINRRAMLIEMLEEATDAFYAEDNWLLQECIAEDIEMIYEALNELQRAKVGDKLTKHFCFHGQW